MVHQKGRQPQGCLPFWWGIDAVRTPGSNTRISFAHAKAPPGGGTASPSKSEVSRSAAEYPPMVHQKEKAAGAAFSFFSSLSSLHFSLFSPFPPAFSFLYYYIPICIHQKRRRACPLKQARRLFKFFYAVSMSSFQEARAGGRQPQGYRPGCRRWRSGKSPRRTRRSPRRGCR